MVPRNSQVLHVLPTELSTSFVVFCCLMLLLGSFLTWLNVRLAAFCRDAVAFVQNQNKNAVSLRRITETECALTELSDSFDALYESHKKLRSRIGMRRLREKRKDPENGLDSSPPADEAGRAAYKATLRNKLKSEGRL